jgi:hypothetical protein
MRSWQGLLIPIPVVVATFVAGVAEAQSRPPPAGSRANSQFLLHREEAGGADGTTARARARAGDCAGALPAFDAAVRVTIEPTLRRDRGLCHEKLGDPFPAIDDYRAYLAARPDAPDADAIRERLLRLEDQVGVGSAAAEAVKDRDESNVNKAAGQVSVGIDGGKKSSASSSKRRARSATVGPKAGEQDRSYDYYVAEERLADSSERSALRFGDGWIIGPYLSIPRYFVGSEKGVVVNQASYAIGATIRYSFGPGLSFISELGFAGLASSGALAANGPLAFAGVEVRVPLDTYASNQLILGVGPGFERYTVSGSELGLNIFSGRGRAGYRHVFGPSIGLEFLLDGGPAYLTTTGVKSDGKVVGLVGGSYAFVIAF